jgi:quercetin dioxygenase-like cupin family protein
VAASKTGNSAFHASPPAPTLPEPSNAVPSERHSIASAYATTNQQREKCLLSVTPAQIAWRPFDAFHNAVSIAILIGRPGEVGPYVVRMSVPAKIQVAPHAHDHDCLYTVLEGTLHLAEGRKVDEQELRVYPTGSVIVVPKHTHHYFGSQTETVVLQITALGRAPGA